MSYWSRIAGVFRGDRVSREIDEELAAHLEEAVVNGRDPDEARRAFGSMLRLRDESRDVRVVAWLDSLRSDVVFGWRQLRKNRATSLAAILSLALAMGACMAAFRLIDALLLRPLPVSDPGSLFVLTYPFTDETGKQVTGTTFDYPQFRTLRAAVRDEAELVAITSPNRISLTFGGDDQMENFWSQSVSGWMFSSFGLRPAAGRLLTAGDDVKPGGHPVAVISHDYWTRRFGRDPGVVGRKFRIGTALYEIVGVSQAGFTGTAPGTMTDMFVPTMMNARAIDSPYWGWIRTWVRVRPGFDPERVRQKLRAAMYACRQERAKAWGPGAPRARVEEYLRAEVALEPAAAGASAMQRTYRQSLAVVAMVVLLVLLIACTNVANLLTAQAAARGREMALRVSIGAGRWRLAQLCLAESVLMALAASVLGGVFAWWAAPFVVSRINPPDNPARLILPADWRVLGFAAGLTLLVTFLFGIVPALRASAVKPMAALRGGEDPRSRRRLMNALLAAQVAFCFVVCFVTAVFVTTFDRLTHQPTGFAQERLLALSIETRNSKLPSQWSQVQQHLKEVAGVESVAICDWALMSGNSWTGGVAVDGRSRENQDPYFLAVSGGWLETMKIPLIDGRDFRAEDPFPGVAIVNEEFARQFFGGRNPVGRTFETIDADKHGRSLIVGYTKDARYFDMRVPIRPTVYVPRDLLRADRDSATFMVRTSGPDPTALAAVLKREVARVRPEMRVADIRTQTELVEQHTVRERLLAMLSVFFAVVAVVLAGIGLYGVLNYSVLQRRREIGIRMALGARAGDVARRVSAEVLAMIAVGAVAGVGAGIASQRYIESLLFGVKMTDPVMLAWPAITILAAAMLAALPPVIQAVRIDPATTLRAE